MQDEVDRRSQMEEPSAETEQAPSEALSPVWDAKVEARLFELLYAGPLESHELERQVEALASEYDDAVYNQLIYILSHLHFEPEEAKLHWHQILRHRETMQEHLGAEVDLRVALISYFLDVQRKLKSPMVIEMRLFERTRALAYHDELTGLRNYRFFNEFLHYEIQRSDQYSWPVSLVMVDIDDFKIFNDRFGHEAGNSALADLGGLLQQALRRVDVAARFGGEEFVLVLPSTAKIGALMVAERARRLIEEAEFSPGANLTVSLGVATYPADARDAGDLVRRADRAMYEAKAGGKNQVQAFGSDRRSYRRVTAAVPGSFQLVGSESHALITVDLSLGGVSFLSDQMMEIGSLLDLRLGLPEPGQELSLAGRVVEVEEREPAGCRVALRIVDMDSRQRRRLQVYLRQLKRPDAVPA
jgi:diguanylate cyclase (GGDEF)-like protein